MHPPISLNVQRLEELVRRCATLSAEQRAELLASECHDDSPLHAAVVHRLSQHEQTQSWPPLCADSGPSQTRTNAVTDIAPTVSLDSGSTQDAQPLWCSIDGSQTALEMPQRPMVDASILTRIGAYEVLSEIARGGMGVVYKARDAKLQRLVAIKIPRAAQLEEEGEARFLREARAAARLHHPNICPIYEVGQSGAQPFIALGFVDGPTLKQWAQREKPNARQAADLIAKVARAVEHAHEHDVIHRDIKPSNIMLEDATGEPVLMDFGLAKQLSETESEFTRSGQIMGTPVYMAPEQAAGQLERIGAATDVYALGAVLYELLTGQPPFSGALGEVLRKVQCEPPPAPRSLAPTVHRDLETICLKAMAKEPAARYANAAELADDLQRFAAGDAILARREGLVGRLRRTARRHWRGAALAALLGGVAIAIVAYATSGANRARQTTALARQFDARLDSARGSLEQRRELEALLASLAQLDAAEAARLRQRMHASFARQVLEKPRIEPADVGRFEEELSWLAQHDPPAAARLQAQFERRMRTWQSTFRLTAPFAGWEAILPQSEVAVRDDRLVRQAAAPTPAAWHRVQTSVSSRGYARLVAVFGPGWHESNEVGLLIHASERRGYEFRLHPAAPATPAVDEGPASAVPVEAESFASALAKGGSVGVSIFRDGHLLRNTALRAAEFSPHQQGELLLEALVEGSRIEFKVAGEHAVTFDDVFGHMGEPQSRFGLVWPPAAQLVSLEAFSQALPLTPSPLEEGDELFARREWPAALEKYGAQAAQASDARQVAQAQFKTALCLAQLQRQAEAKKVFEALMTSGDDRVQVLAACQLWLLAARDKQYDEAQFIFENLQSRYSFEELAFLVPEEDRNRIVHTVYAATTGFNLFRFDEKDLKFLRQAHAVAGLLDQHATIETRNSRVWQLVRANHRCGQLDEAIRLGAEYLSQFDGPVRHCPLNMIDEVSWMLRQQNRHGEAGELLNHFLHHPANAQGHARELLVERARLHAAEDRWAEAAKDLDEFLSNPAATANYTSFSHACLMRGFLYERAGDPQAAMAVWQRGNFHEWAKNLPASPRRQMPRITGMGAAGAYLLAALTDELTDARFEEIYASPLSGDWGGVTGELFQQYIPLVASAARHVGRDEFSRNTCRRLAYRECSFQQFLHDPLVLIFLELSREGAAPKLWNDDERDLIWQFVHAALEEYRVKRIGNTQAVQFLLTWKGANNVFGWQGLASSLPPHVRCGAAYMFGHRYEKLGKPQDAEQFFRTALADAPADSPVARLAQAQLDRFRQQP